MSRVSGKDPGGRLILRGAQATAFGFAIRFGARLLFLFIAGRLFGVTAFGAYVLAVAVVEVAVSIGGLGTKKILFQLLDGHDRRSARPLAHILIDAALLVTLASTLLAGAIMAAALLLPASMLPAATATALFCLAPMVAGQALLDLFLAATRWKHAIRYEVIGRSLVEPYALVAAALGAYYLGFGPYGLLIGYWCGTLAALGYALFGTRRSYGDMRIAHYRPEPRVLAQTLRSAAPNTANDLLNALYTRVDLYLVGILLGEGAAGIYGMARQLAAPIRQVRQSFDGLLIPLVAKTLAVRGSRATGDALASATRLILVIQLPGIIILFAAGRPLLDWFGPGFAAGYWALLALALAEAIQAAFSIGDLIFVYLRPKVGLRVTLASIAVGIAAAFLLIPAFGIAGAALSVLIAYSLRAILRSILLRSSFGVNVPRAHHAGPIFAGLLGIGAVAALRALGYEANLGLLLAGLAAYGIGLAAWLGLSKEKLGLTGFIMQGESAD